jgi:threonine dehydratase
VSIFVPRISPESKVRRLRDYGAAVHIVGDHYVEALGASLEHARETGALAIHAYDQQETLAGQGTLALEWERQSPELDTVLVATGGGGLIGGMAAWYRGRVRIISVEPELAPTLAVALQRGRPSDVAPAGIAVDSLGARRVGELMFPLAQQFIESAILVPDDAILQAQCLLWDRLRAAVEPGGATALAALCCRAYVPQPGERVGILVCGANVNPADVV